MQVARSDNVSEELNPCFIGYDGFRFYRFFGIQDDRKVFQFYVISFHCCYSVVVRTFFVVFFFQAFLWSTLCYGILLRTKLRAIKPEY